MSMEDRMRADLRQAMKDRDGPAVVALRTALAAIANAEAVPDDGSFAPTHGRLVDHPRRVLTPDDVLAIVRHQIDDRRATIARSPPTAGRRPTCRRRSTCSSATWPDGRAGRANQARESRGDEGHAASGQAGGRGHRDFGTMLWPTPMVVAWSTPGGPRSSVRMPRRTTRPGRRTRPASSTSSPRARRRPPSTSVAARASSGGWSPPAASTCSASSPTRGWPRSPGATG